MSRSKWKPVFQAKCIHKRGKASLEKLKIWSRSSTISRKCVGVKLFVYNGKKFVSLLVSKEMLGHKFGEFVFTKRLGKTIHLIGKKSKKGKKLKKK